MCIIDPPYYRKVDQEWDKQWFTKNDYLAWCKSWIEEIAGVVKKSATVWLFGYPEELSYLLGYMREFGFQFKQQIVIDKWSNNPNKFEFDWLKSQDACNLES